MSIGVGAGSVLTIKISYTASDIRRKEGKIDAIIR